MGVQSVCTAITRLMELFTAALFLFSVVVNVVMVFGVVSSVKTALLA